MIAFRIQKDCHNILIACKPTALSHYMIAFSSQQDSDNVLITCRSQQDCHNILIVCRRQQVCHNTWFLSVANRTVTIYVCF